MLLVRQLLIVERFDDMIRVEISGSTLLIKVTVFLGMQPTVHRVSARGISTIITIIELLTIQ